MKNKYRTLILLGAALGCFLLFAGLSQWGLFSILDLKISDLMAQVRGVRPADPRIVIVAVDDASMNVMGQKWQWNREIFAEGLKTIARDKPQVIMMDFMFAHSGGAKEDHALSQALEAIKPLKVVSGITLTQRVTLENSAKPQAFILVEKSLRLPVFNEMDYGFINIETGQDATIRKTALLRVYENETYEALALKALRYSQKDIYQAWSGELKDQAGQEYRINFAGPNKTYPWVSYYQLSKKLLPDGFFKDKLVIIGPTFDDSQDFYFTPFFRHQGINLKMAGVEIHANILDNLLNRHFLTSLKPVSQFMLFVALALLIFFALAFFQQSAFRLAAVVGIPPLYLSFVFYQFCTQKVLFPVFYPILAWYVCALCLLKIISWWRAQDLKSELERLKTNANFQLEEFCVKYDLSKREKEILGLILQNLTNTQITKKLFISLSTVKTHITSLYKKTQVKSREELVLLLGNWNKV